MERALAKSSFYLFLSFFFFSLSVSLSLFYETVAFFGLYSPARQFNTLIFSIGPLESLILSYQGTMPYTLTSALLVQSYNDREVRALKVEKHFNFCRPRSGEIYAPKGMQIHLGRLTYLKKRFF